MTSPGIKNAGETPARLHNTWSRPPPVTASIFSIQHHCPHTRARTGTLTLRGIPIETPAFMPVGTRGTVKAMLPEEVAAIGYRSPRR
jgi:hypothetical protein